MERIGRFRIRGQQVTRLETFVDAAFAFSLTLLVIVFDDLPGSMTELRSALRQIPTFLFCFAMLAMFWSSHNRWSRRYGLEDARSTVLSLALVLVVMVFVYPLRMVASAALHALSAGWVPNQAVLDATQPMLDLQTMFIVYAVGFGLLSLILWRLYAHALACATTLDLDDEERFETGNEVGIHLILTLTAVISLLLASAMLVCYPHDRRLPGWIVSLPAWVYMLIGPAIGAYLWRRGHKRGLRN